MSNRKEDWIYIQQPDNAQKIASPNYIKNLLGLSSLDVKSLFERLNSIEFRLDALERPLKRTIVQLLEKEWHNRMWIDYRVHLGYWQLDSLLRELVAEDKLETRKSGTQTLYRVKVEVKGE